MTESDVKLLKIAFSFIGGEHQFLHGAPVAARLSQMDKISVTGFVLNKNDKTVLTQILDTFGAQNINIQVMDLPFPLSYLSHNLKTLRLLIWAKFIKSFDCIITLERTSTILKRIYSNCPPMFHIPHGAGDRAKGFEKRFRYFDLVLVAGEKDKNRLIQLGLQEKESIFCVGYIKTSALTKINKEKISSLFSNKSINILYNPHFDKKLSSIDSFGLRIINSLKNNVKYNLIFAPHIRLSEKMSNSKYEFWNKYSIYDNIIVDLSSNKLSDMTYTMAADLYIGDVSSQVYEYLTIPKPCLFLNSHNVDWQESPDYKMWRLGDVLDKPENLMAAIDNAFKQHSHYVTLQQEAVLEALGPQLDDEGRDAMDKAAEIISNVLRREPIQR